MSIENGNKTPLGNYDNSEGFIDVSSRETFILGLPMVIKTEIDKQRLIDYLKKLDFDSNGEKRDYFASLVKEVEMFKI